jgi:hypothetical protein
MRADEVMRESGEHPWQPVAAVTMNAHRDVFTSV